MRYILRDAAASSGHVYLPEEELSTTSATLLNVPPELCRQALRSMLISGALMSEADENNIRRAGRFHAHPRGVALGDAPRRLTIGLFHHFTA